MKTGMKQGRQGRRKCRTTRVAVTVTVTVTVVVWTPTEGLIITGSTRAGEEEQEERREQKQQKKQKEQKEQKKQREQREHTVGRGGKKDWCFELTTAGIN